MLRSSAALRAGHSHSKNVAHRKAAVAKKKMAVWGKISKQITAAVKLGGADAQNNGMLALAISRAKAANMEKAKVEAAVAAASNVNEGAGEEVVFECVQPGGVAVVVECVTNSRARTSNFVKHGILSNGALLSPVRFLFERRGILRFAGADIERVTDVALEVDHEIIDIKKVDERNDDDDVEANTLVFCPPSSVHALATSFSKGGIDPKAIDIGYWPLEKVPLHENDEAVARLEQLQDALDEIDDVSRVYHNATW
jgi:YebC/PmpR family DNA-binding regulatory protein